MAAVLLHYDGTRLTRNRCCTTRWRRCRGRTWIPRRCASSASIRITQGARRVRTGSVPGVFSGSSQGGKGRRAAVVRSSLPTTPPSTISSSWRPQTATTSNAIHSTRFHSSTRHRLPRSRTGRRCSAKRARRAGIAFDSNEAHSARYDAEVTAALFCAIVNRWQEMGGWPLRTEGYFARSGWPLWPQPPLRRSTSSVRPTGTFR